MFKTFILGEISGFRWVEHRSILVYWYYIVLIVFVKLLYATVREEHRLVVFVNKMLMEICGQR